MRIRAVVYLLAMGLLMAAPFPLVAIVSSSPAKLAAWVVWLAWMLYWVRARAGPEFASRSVDRVRVERLVLHSIARVRPLGASAGRGDLGVADG
jgi:hypothetical protein